MKINSKKVAVKLLRIVDKYNDGKVWLVKRYKCGHYYFNQENKGQRLNKKFTKTTKKNLKSIGLEF